jgi:uncharacterized protein (TIGR03437 family)
LIVEGWRDSVRKKAWRRQGQRIADVSAQQILEDLKYKFLPRSMAMRLICARSNAFIDFTTMALLLLVARAPAQTGNVITTVAGNGTSGYSGDGGPATSAELHQPYGVAVDAAGNIYIADTSNNRIRKVAAATGVITTVAGQGGGGYWGDGGPATDAGLNGPDGVAVDGASNLYIADNANNRIRMVAAATGAITTVAGDGSPGYSGDGGPAASAEINYPTAIAADGAGNIYLVDSGDHVIRKVVAATGTITTVAGNGVAGYAGDGGPATAASLNWPEGVALDGAGNLYIGDSGNARIRKVAAATGIITTVAGDGVAGYSGDGGQATGAELYAPCGAAVDGAGNLYIADTGNNRIRKVVAETGSITTVAGDGIAGYSGDGSTATGAELVYPAGVVVDSVGNLYIADRGNNVIRKVISTSATGTPTINAGGAVNAASYVAGAPLAPGSIVAVYGDFLLSSPSSAVDLPMPTNLAGLSLQFGGVKAPLFYASSGQVNLQVPWGIGGQTQTSLSATLGAETGAAQTVQIAPYSPGIFAMNGQGTGQGAILDASYRLVDVSNPAIPGSTVLQIFCTGLGPVTNQPASGSPAPSSPLAETPTTPTVTVGGVSANVLFSGLAPGSVGEYQVNALVPATVVAGNAVPVAISIGSVISNTVTVAVQGSTGTGTLDIEVTGLPAGTSANVSITSTNGYANTLTASASLQVPSGTYNIATSPVALGNVGYFAIAQQSVNVPADSSVNVQEPYTTVIPNTTKVLDQTGTSTLTIAADGSTLTLSAQSATAQALAPGDVLVAAPNPAAPHGLLRKIVSVTQAAGQVTATTTQAALTDAIQQANVQFAANLLPQNILSAAPLLPGVEVHVGRWPTSARVSSAGPRSAISPMDTGDSCANSQIVVTEMKDVEIASGLNVSGEIEVCGNFTIQTNINWLGLQLNSLTATATFGAHTELTMTGQAAVAEFSVTQPIATIQFADIVVPVGPVPVDVVPEITIQIGASGAITAAFSAGVSQDASVTGGFSFANGQVSPVLQSTPLTFQLQPLSVAAGLTATVDIEADIDLLLYDVAGPYFKPQAYLQFDANVLQNPWWTLSGGLKGPTGLELNPDLDVLGFDNLPDISFANLFDVSQTLLQAGGGFPSLHGLTPNAAPAGSTSVSMTVSGSNFVSGSTINFNGTPLTTWFLSSSEINATVPASDLASTGAFPVTVSNPAPGGGTSAPADFTVEGASNPQPTITGLSPSSVAAGSGPLTLTISGSGFIALSAVTFNGALHATTFVSSGQLHITLAALDLAAVGSFAVVVSNPAPGGGSSNAVAFAVQSEVVAPKLTSLTLSASSVVAGGSVTGTVTLNGAAPAGGVQIPIEDSPAILQVGSSVTVPAGQITGTFTIGAPAVTSPTTVIVTATLVSVSVSARLVINPGTTTNPFQNSTFDIYGTLNISGQSVPVEIQTLALSDGTLGTISNSGGSLISLTMLFNEQSSVSGNTVTYSGVDPSSSFLNASTSVFYFSFSSATLSLTVQSPTVGASVTGTLQFTSSGATLSGIITGTINSVSGP